MLIEHLAWCTEHLAFEEDRTAALTFERGVRGRSGHIVVVIVERGQALADTTTSKVQIVTADGQIAVKFAGVAVAVPQEMIQSAQRTTRRVKFTGGVRNSLLNVLALEDRLTMSN